MKKSGNAASGTTKSGLRRRSSATSTPIPRTRIIQIDEHLHRNSTARDAQLYDFMIFSLCIIPLPHCSIIGRLEPSLQ